MLSRIVMTLTALALLATPTYAQKEKKAALLDFPFWSAPKTPHARAFVPGLQAALQLTPQQVEKILAAMDKTVNSPEIRDLPRKGDPNATADELAKANSKRAEATEKLHKEIDAILTRDQKGLIEKVNDAYARVASEVGEEFQPKFADAKGNAEDTAKLRKEMAEAITTGFTKKLDNILTDNQKTAVKKAAEEEVKRAGNKPNKVKPEK
jgi:hypothetical protein